MATNMVCNECGRWVYLPCVAANDNNPDEFVVVACDTLLRNPVHFHRMAIATANLDKPRREIPNWMADTIYGYEGSIMSLDGDHFILEDDAIDAAFNDDWTFRWLSDYIDFAAQPPGRRPQHRILMRLRLLDLAFQIDKPNIARHFRR